MVNIDCICRYNTVFKTLGSISHDESLIVTLLVADYTTFRMKAPFLECSYKDGDQAKSPMPFTHTAKGVLRRCGPTCNGHHPINDHGKRACRVITMTEILLVKSPSFYNPIIGGLTLYLKGYNLYLSPENEIFN